MLYMLESNKPMMKKNNASDYLVRVVTFTSAFLTGGVCPKMGKLQKNMNHLSIH